MASAGSGGTLPPNFMLTPQQQQLLFAALSSNEPQSAQDAAPNSALTMSPDSLEHTPLQNTNGAVHDSPFLDSYQYGDVGDSSFDFSLIDDQPRMIGDLPATVKSESTEGEGNEKRSHPDDEDDDDENDPKRRESSEKLPKKPGRKPLTSEPTSKRKAQNRAAQRAFRERKEKHLKDLETQVEELQKASEATNNENSKLRAQVDRMTSELNQYKQKLTLMNKPSDQPKDKIPFGNAALGNMNDLNFQFNFPKFGGSLPGPPSSKPQRSVSQPISPDQRQQTASPQKSQHSDKKSPLGWQQSDAQFNDDLAKFSGVFTPSMASTQTNGSRPSLDSGNYSTGAGATSSPSASSHSNSNAGPSSSCGTSPEPFTQSPLGSKPVDTMTTIGEEHTSLPNEPFAQFANIDFNTSTNFDWLAQQNGGSFDPQLFGDYREPQDNILSNPGFDDYFNDALDADFFTPYNAVQAPTFSQKQPQQAKPNLMEQIDAQKNDYNDGLPTRKDNINCNQIWEKLQECPNAQNGEFDLDGLCSELTKKAKCSGSGPVVGETDFDTILKKYMGQDAQSNCVASKLGIELNRDLQPNNVHVPKTQP